MREAMTVNNKFNEHHSRWLRQEIENGFECPILNDFILHGLIASNMYYINDRLDRKLAARYTLDAHDNENLLS